LHLGSKNKRRSGMTHIFPFTPMALESGKAYELKKNQFLPSSRTETAIRTDHFIAYIINHYIPAALYCSQ
jgi:hypothetical protein